MTEQGPQSGIQPADARMDELETEKGNSGSLLSKNVRIHDRRTSVRLEPEMWRALREIAEMENCSIHDLCTAVHELKENSASFTAALRVFLMEYYRAVAKTSQQVSLVQKRLKLAQGGGQAGANGFRADEDISPVKIMA